MEEYCMIKLKCNKCGKDYDIRLSKDENELYSQGTPLEELFENRSPILKQQVVTGLCDKCFIKYYKSHL